MNCLCDTNVLSELCRPFPNQGVIEWTHTVSEISLSVITKEVNMLIIEGIYNGKTVDLSETVPFKKKKKVFVTFPDDLSEKTELTVTSAQVLLDLFGSWEDSRDAEEIIRESRGFLKKSRFSTQRYFEMKQDEKNLEK